MKILPEQQDYEWVKNLPEQQDYEWGDPPIAASTYKTKSIVYTQSLSLVDLSLCSFFNRIMHRWWSSHTISYKRYYLEVR